MRVLILGASGRTGKLATAAALKRGHTVTALVRKASSMQSLDGLTIVRGTPLEQSDIEKAFAATPNDPIQTVMVTLNASRETDSPFSKPVAPPSFLRDCVRNTTAIMAQQRVKRIVIMSAFGIGSSWSQLPWLVKLIFRYTNMSYQMKDHEETDAAVKRIDSLDWMLVRPAMLKEGDAAPVKEFGEVGKGLSLFGGITRASVAEFMVEAAEQGEWNQQAVVIAN